MNPRPLNYWIPFRRFNRLSYQGMSSTRSQSQVFIFWLCLRFRNKHENMLIGKRFLNFNWNSFHNLLLTNCMLYSSGIQCFSRLKIYWFIVLTWVFKFHFDCKKILLWYYVLLYLIAHVMCFCCYLIVLLLIRFFCCIKTKLRNHNQPHGLSFTEGTPSSSDWYRKLIVVPWRTGFSWNKPYMGLPFM